jgi:hypothetical protein
MDGIGEASDGLRFFIFMLKLATNILLATNGPSSADIGKQHDSINISLSWRYLFCKRYF